MCQEVEIIKKSFLNDEKQPKNIRKTIWTNDSLNDYLKEIIFKTYFWKMKQSEAEVHFIALI